MRTTINVNGKPVDIELTADQVDAIRRASVDPMKDYKTWEDVCNAGGLDPLKCLPYPSPVTKKQVSGNGLFKLETIFDAFNLREEFKSAANEPWEADYADDDQYKWYPWHEWNTSVGAFVFAGTRYTCTYTTLGSRLCTDTDEKATYIGKTFNKEWNEFLNPQI